MRTARGLLWILVCALATLASCSGRAGTQRPVAAPARQIPVEVRDGVVYVPVQVGQSRVLRVILDTGMGFDGVLLHEPLPESSVAGPVYEVRIPGAGTGEPARGLMAESASFRAGPVEFKGQRLVWLVDGTMSGFSGDGVMGYSLFGHWQVEIDYDNSKIILHEPGSFRPDSSWTALPMTLHKNSTPWVKLRASIDGAESLELDSYLDLADYHEVVFLVRDDAKFKLPGGLEEHYLGRGLSGDVSGWGGRAKWVELGPFRFEDVAVAYAPDEARSKQPGADAVVSGSLLARLNTVYDYAGGKMYVRPRAPKP
ncbi:MAG: hypothetical protein NTX53_20945 [candidate division WOR-3 bacterium]|nr:hypothetical protein [candidate division WOR-3 bacterium]